MTSFVFVLMILSGVVFIISVLLMSPKGGLGFGVGGMSTSNEYGSKKSIEFTLKRSAIISIIIFMLGAIVYPYISNQNGLEVDDATKNKLEESFQGQLKKTEVQDKIKNIKIEETTKENVEETTKETTDK